jgi:hypothetical protein
MRSIISILLMLALRRFHNEQWCAMLNLKCHALNQLSFSNAASAHQVYVEPVGKHAKRNGRRSLNDATPTCKHD